MKKLTRAALVAAAMVCVATGSAWAEQAGEKSASAVSRYSAGITSSAQSGQRSIG